MFDSIGVIILTQVDLWRSGTISAGKRTTIWNINSKHQDR